MFLWLRSLLSAECVVQLHSRRIRVRDISAGKTFDFEPVLGIDAAQCVVAIGRPIPASAVNTYEPFASPAALARDRRIAELILQYAYSRLGTSAWLKPAPKVVLHVVPEPDNAIRTIDDEALKELSRSAGARLTVVHRGKSISDDVARRELRA
jgi:hypothetical protein